MLSLNATPAMKSHLETQLNFMTDMSNKLCDSACRLNDLNLHLGQEIFEDTINTSRHMLNANDPVECTSIALAQMQPLAERMRNFQQQVLSVVAGTQAELTRTAENHIPEASRTAAAMADEMVKRAHEETERATERQRSAMERVSKASDAATARAGQSLQQGQSSGSKQPGQAGASQQQGQYGNLQQGSSGQTQGGRMGQGPAEGGQPNTSIT